MIEGTAKGRQILVVEDEMMIVLMIEDMASAIGAQVVGPVAQLEEALSLAKDASFDAAVLDINIQGGNTYAVADILAERGIPFVWCSGYDDWAFDERHRHRPRLIKPYSANALEGQVLELLGVSSV